ncbi:MAG: class I SAM-dependent RNA methyltransferase [Pseudomonadota bacterium]
MPPPAVSRPIFLAAPPGLEPLLLAEARERGFIDARAMKGGVAVAGDWREAWRANLELRGAVRVLWRMGSFRAAHLAQLDRRARSFPWAETLRSDVPVRVEASCRRSKIYHSGAARERIGRAVAETLGAPVDDAAEVRVTARIIDDLCTLSVDLSGEPLHKRGFKQEVAKAPMRETLAALFLRACGYAGDEPVVDPVCGSGTFVAEAAEIALGLAPGRGRAFAFEKLATFDAEIWRALRSGSSPRPRAATPRFYGFDRDPGAVRMSAANAARAGVDQAATFEARDVADLQPPEGPAGLVIANPPYGARIGANGALRGLYAGFGRVLRERFSGWRVGIVTSDPALAKATALAFSDPGPVVDHGGIKVRLYTTGRLP